jgi:KDO2-lipid IV(A) lauroyltransferase
LAKNRTLQRLRRRLVYWGARLAQWLALRLPFDAALALGGWLGRLAFAVMWRERRRTLEHLATAFGDEKSEAERREIARSVFENAGRCAAEIMLAPRWTDEQLRERIHFADPEPLMQAFRAGHGVVIMTGHIGNWELLGAYGSRIVGLNAGVIARRLSNPHLDRLINQYRRNVGLKVFLRGEPARGFFRHLTRGGTLAILADQDVRRVDGTFVDFFGRPAHTATGPAELILRSRAAWFFAFLQRSSDGRSHELHCAGPLPVPEGEDHATRVRRMTEEYVRQMEKAIRLYPDQWMWMHNRWRRKPKS